MRYRKPIGVLAALGLGALVAPAALSAPVGKSSPPTPRPKHYCNLIMDAYGDNRLPTTYVTDASLDITSGDFSSSSSSLAATLRFRPGVSPLSTPRVYVFRFAQGSSDYAFELAVDPTGRGTARVLVDGRAYSPAIVTYHLDQWRSSVTWYVWRDTLPVEYDMPFGPFIAETAVGTAGTQLNADSAYSTRTYEDRHPSCLRAP